MFREEINVHYGNAASRWWRWLVIAAAGVLGGLALCFSCYVLFGKCKAQSNILKSSIGLNFFPLKEIFNMSFLDVCAE